MGMWAPRQNKTSCTATWISPTAFTCCPAARASTTSRVSNRPHPQFTVQPRLSPHSDLRAYHSGAVHHKRKNRVSVCVHTSWPPEWVVRTETSLLCFHMGNLSMQVGQGIQGGGVSPGSLLRGCTAGGPPPEWPTDLSERFPPQHRVDPSGQ